MQITSEEIYDSARRPPTFVEEIISLIRYRDLVNQFVSRAIKIRYKRSALGIIWTMLNPLLMMIVLTFVFSSIFEISIQRYPIYVLSGLVMWNFFSHTTSTSMGEMLWSSALLNRIYLPKSIFSISAIGVGLVNLFLSLIPLFLISFVLGNPISLAVLVLPVSILLLALFALGVGLILATAAVYFADMLPVYEVILTIWFYATPIIYPVDKIPPHLTLVLKFNPMYYLIQIFRAPLFEGKLPEPSVWAIAAVCAVGAAIIGGLVFTAKSNEYAYRI